MKKTAILLFIFLANFYGGFGQTDVCLVYVEASATERLSELKTMVQRVINQHNGKDLILYVSNGGHPEIGTDYESIQKAMNRLNFIKPPRPDFFQDVDSINAILSAIFPTEILGNGSADQINLPISLCFFLNCDQTILYQEDKTIFDRLLQSNRLMVGFRKPWQTYQTHLYLDMQNSDGNDSSYVATLEKTKKYDIHTY